MALVLAYLVSFKSTLLGAVGITLYLSKIESEHLPPIKTKKISRQPCNHIPDKTGPADLTYTNMAKTPEPMSEFLKYDKTTAIKSFNKHNGVR